jgi:predicted nucleic acid-binding protein
MGILLLDTDAIIDYLKGFPSSVSFIQGLHQRGETLAVCDIVIAEVYAGLHPPDRAKAAVLLTSLAFLATTPAIAQQAGEWRYAFARQGIQLATSDTLVAATAYAHQAAIVTGNLKDYPMKGVTVLPLPRVKP